MMWKWLKLIQDKVDLEGINWAHKKL